MEFGTCWWVVLTHPWKCPRHWSVPIIGSYDGTKSETRKWHLSVGPANLNQPDASVPSFVTVDLSALGLSGRGRPWDGWGAQTSWSLLPSLQALLFSSLILTTLPCPADLHTQGWVPVCPGCMRPGGPSGRRGICALQSRALGLHCTKHKFSPPMPCSCQLSGPHEGFTVWEKGPGTRGSKPVQPWGFASQ